MPLWLWLVAQSGASKQYHLEHMLANCFYSIDGPGAYLTTYMLPLLFTTGCQVVAQEERCCIRLGVCPAGGERTYLDPVPLVPVSPWNHPRSA